MARSRIVLVVVCALAGVLFICVAGIIALAFSERGVPDVITNIASGALGALSALLASTKSSDDDPMPVTVTNAPGDAVPVEEAPKRRG